MNRPPRRQPEPAALYATLKDAVRTHGVSRTTLYRLLASGDARAIKLGRSTLVDLAVLDAYLAACPRASFRDPSK